MATTIVSEDTEKEVDGWRRAEIVAALVALYHMTGRTFEPADMPRQIIGKMVGVKRHTIQRCIIDAKAGIELAEDMRKRLLPYYANQSKRQAERAEKRKAARARQYQNAKARRLAKQEGGANGNQRKSPGRKRSGESALRQLQQGRRGAGS